MDYPGPYSKSRHTRAVCNYVGARKCSRYENMLFMFLKCLRVHSQHKCSKFSRTFKQKK
ncbi:hypothetical protein X975_05513, partial [Stegodyphus mimosarum]